MKTKYLIATLILIAFAICSLAQLNDDGYKWKEFSNMGNSSTSLALKLGYVMGTAYASAFIKELANLYIEDIKKDIEIMKTFENINNAEKDLNYYDFSGLTFDQYITGLDEFYSNYRNIQIPIILAMRIIKHEVDGTPQEEINERILFFRKRFSKN